MGNTNGSPSKKRPLGSASTGDIHQSPQPPARRLCSDKGHELIVTDTYRAAQIAAMEMGIINARAESEQKAGLEKFDNQYRILEKGPSENLTSIRDCAAAATTEQLAASRALANACAVEKSKHDEASYASQENGIILAETRHLLEMQTMETVRQKKMVTSLQQQARENQTDVSFVKASLAGYVDLVDSSDLSCTNNNGSQLVTLRETICTTVGDLVVQQHAGKGEQRLERRQFTKAERAFYGLILAYAGVLALTFIAYVLGGPAPSQVKKWRSADVPIMKMGVSQEAINHNMANVIMPALKDYGLLKALFMLGEDGSALKRFLELVVEDGDIVLYGCNGGPHIVSSLEELIKIILEHGLCTTLYVISLIPQIRGAPSLPIVIDANDNTMKQIDMHQTLMYILEAATENGIPGQIFGGVGDGAPFIRKETRALQAHQGTPAEKYLTIDHWLICLFIPYILNYGYYLVTQDFMHVAWRIRLCMLRPSKTLTLMPGVEMTSKVLLEATASGCKLGLLAQDLNYKEKQHWQAVLRLSGVDSKGVKNSGILAELDQTAGFLGAAMYLTFLSYYVQIFIGETETVDSIINKCGWILAFLVTWKFIVERSPELTSKEHFLTHETFTDVVISVTNLLLLIVLFREKFGGEFIGNFEIFRLLPSYISSRFLEYLFAFCRSEHRNATSFGAYAGFVHVKHFHWIKKLEAIGGLELPSSKRGILRGPPAIDSSKGFTMKTCEEVSDGKICDILDAAIGQISAHCYIICQDNDIDPEVLPTPTELKTVVLIPKNFDVGSDFLSLKTDRNEDQVVDHEQIRDDPSSDESDVDDDSDSDESIDGAMYKVENIVDDCLRNGKRFFYIKWLGYGDEQNTWEPEVHLEDRFMISEYYEEKQKNKSSRDSESGRNERDLYTDLPSDRQSLEKLLEGFSLSTGGTVIEMKDRLLNHQDREGFLSHVRSMATAATENPSKKPTKKQTKKQTKLDADHNKMKRAIDLIRDQIDPEIQPAEGTELKKMRSFLSLFNSYISK